MSEPAPARMVALDALSDRKQMPTRRLDRLLGESGLSSVDAALATELVMGVTRRRRTIDAIIRAYSDRPKRNIGPLVRQGLRLGVYQLIFTDRVPDHAAVNESVELVARKQPRQAGFVNAVLREVGRGLGDIEPTDLPAGEYYVLITPDRARRMDRPICPAPDDQPVQHVGVACSLPDELAQRWLARSRNKLAQALQLGMQTHARPPMILRVNTARTTVPAVVARLAEQDVPAEAHDNGRSVVLTGHADPAALEVFREGLVTVQDATASAVAPMLAVGPGMRVLDFCAAPGTKTTHLAELMQGEGEIVAVDVNEDKLARVRAAAERSGYADMIRTCSTEQVGSLTPGSFDRVLVDAPCTNTGVLARRAEARWNFTEEAIRKIVVDQKTILSLAAMFCSSTGRLVYSTCSIEPEENEQVVKAFIRRRGGFKIAQQRQTLPIGWDGPTHWQDGGYWAVLGGG